MTQILRWSRQTPHVEVRQFLVLFPVFHISHRKLFLFSYTMLIRPAEWLITFPYCCVCMWEWLRGMCKCHTDVQCCAKGTRRFICQEGCLPLWGSWRWVVKAGVNEFWWRDMGHFFCLCECLPGRVCMHGCVHVCKMCFHACVWTHSVSAVQFLQ